jgi:hypothetical protein
MPTGIVILGATVLLPFILCFVFRTYNEWMLGRELASKTNHRRPQ